ncbi:response regulator transcription factor [Mucilaginibacter sp.]|jgi:DNA-binding NarL/FixJ family response regulator|uniref:LuxR C-terminal-related transcriptional regulator n=1 Tax=Mucilaginibacter sp. TaxID=1882438 RepID=UPI00263A1F14|nr:response regulator transcription factor [Mucilaginibacter sp.]
MMDIRVVIFEDNFLLRESLFQLINGTPGLICTGAFANCDNLIFNISKTYPDVVLLDIKMPGKTGIEGMLIIHDQFPQIKVIMQTVVDDEDKIFASICNGASGYLLKNTPPAALLHAIMEVFEGGAPMTPIIAMKVLEKFRKQSVPTLKEFNNLSNRENEILECLVEGMSYKMIAIARNISIDTVRFHIRNIYEKLHVNSKSEAVVKAMRDKIG